MCAKKTEKLRPEIIIDTKNLPPSVNVDGELLLEEVHYTRMSESLLSEAIRFYNYGLEGEPWLKKENWKPINPATIKLGIDELHESMKASTVNLFRQLIPKNPEKDEQIKVLTDHLKPGVLPDNLKKNSAYQGMYAVFAFLSSEVRNKKGFVREFDQLKGRIMGLRESGSFESAQRKLANAYRKDFSNIYQLLFEPQWGGEKMITWPPSGIPEPWKKAGFGPTEKLYACFCDGYFSAGKEFNLSSDDVAHQKLIEACMYLEDVDNAIQNIQKIIPGQLTSTWINWMAALDYLEAVFKQAVRLHRQQAVILGLPTAFGLIGILRTYLMDLVARTLMITLPHSIEPIYNGERNKKGEVIHNGVNGYTAIALWEALSNKNACNPNEKAGLLNQLAKGLVGKLKDWPEFAKKNSWKDDSCKENQTASDALAKITQQPLVKNFTLRNYDERFAYFPAILSGFYGSVPDAKRAGARFFAQLHIFVAMQILKKLLDQVTDNKKERDALGNFRITACSYLWGGKKPPHDTHRDGINFDFDYGPNLPSWHASVIVELANRWSGKGKEDVEKFLKNEAILNPLNRLESKDDQDILKAYLDKGEKKKRKELLKKARRIYYIDTQKKTKRQQLKEEKLTQIGFKYKSFSFQYILNALVRVWLNHLYAYFRKTLNGEEQKLDEASWWKYVDDEERCFTVTEKDLIGTPHFIDSQACKSCTKAKKGFLSPLQWQMTHLGHLAILLSVPRNVVFASPIVHLRAMRTLRNVFRKPILEGVLRNNLTLDEKAVDLDDYYEGMMLKVVGISGNIQKRIIKTYCQDRSITVDSPLDPLPEAGDTYQVFDITSYCLATEIARFTHFEMDPLIHHNHWHVDYLTKDECNKYDHSVPIRRLQKFSPLWLRLGVDLAPLVEYLDNYKIQNQNERLIATKVVNEYNEVKDFCNNYIELFKKQTAVTPKAATRIDTEILMKNLFEPYKVDSELKETTIGPSIKPTIGPKELKYEYESKVMILNQKCSEVILQTLSGIARKNELHPELRKALEQILPVSQYQSLFGYEEELE